MGDVDRPRSSDFRLARIGAAAALIAVLVTILLIDATSDHYQVDSIVITALLGTLGTLLGIEGVAALRRQPPPPTGSSFERDTRDPED